MVLVGRETGVHEHLCRCSCLLGGLRVRGLLEGWEVMESFATDETGTFTVRMTDDLVERAAALGREHGTAGGSWVVDGGWSRRELANLIALDDDGDPDWWENYGPASGPLSGEWADGMTPERLFGEIGYKVRAVETNDEADVSLGEQADLCDAYEQAYYDAWREEVLRMARYQVEES